MKKEIQLKDNELNEVTGGTVPDLPATQLASNGYSSMLSKMGVHPVDPIIIDPEYEKKEKGEDENTIVPIPY